MVNSWAAGAPAHLAWEVAELHFHGTRISCAWLDLSDELEVAIDKRTTAIRPFRDKKRDTVHFFFKVEVLLVQSCHEEIDAPTDTCLS